MQIYPENQQSLSALLEQARQQGEVWIQSADGQIFILKPEKTKRSALDVAGINVNISTKETVEIIREGRERG
ncbi:MAG: type II toxin-antitoxin system Phd/YefM family antitoxin [Pyrinomonadaceae bacterium]